MQQVRILAFSMITSLLLLSFIPLPAESRDLQQQVDNSGKPPSAKLSWSKDTHDFGEIARGIPVSVEFTFTNSGDAALIINDVITSCGCTASEYTKEPIMPGKSSKIKVSYNAANTGAFSKTITVNSNDQQSAKLLSIKGIVK